MNQGLTGEEISETLALPPELNNFWPNRGYYGTVKHNSRAVYQRYMGWYDANPSDLDNLPPAQVAKKYVELAGGQEALLKNAQANFDKGEYRWVAEILKHAVFANPENVAAKELLADTYEQLGYQAESAIWRAIYLQGAYELRNGVDQSKVNTTASTDTIAALPAGLLFDYLAISLNPEKLAGRSFTIDLNLTDIKEQHRLSVENAVLNHRKTPGNTAGLKPADLKLEISRSALMAILLKQTTLNDYVASKKAIVSGDETALKQLLMSLDKFNATFNIVTP